MSAEKEARADVPAEKKFSRWMRYGLDVREKIRIGDTQLIYIWALCAGFIGAVTALLFSFCVNCVQDLLTGTRGLSQVDAFAGLESWHCVLVPAVGGVLAGSTLLFMHKFVPVKATEYMEAIALGDGYVPPKPSLLRSLSAVFTIGSGAAIGREGPLIQTSAVAASWLGAKFNLPPPRLRLVVACAAASAMAATFHTPLSGGLFVGEIVLGALTLDFLAPLLVASCAGYLTLSMLGAVDPIYHVSGEVAIGSNHLVVALSCIALGVVASLAANVWLWLLKKARRLLNGKHAMLPVRLALAGALVGAAAVFFPEITGNGYNMIRGIVASEFSPEEALVLLALKVGIVACVFGVGTVGGALTPSLTIGTFIGFLFSALMTRLGVPGDHAIAYSLVGMAAFFTTAANAPMTSLLLVVEFTLAGTLMFPLVIGVVVSYGIARLLRTESMYHDALTSGPRSIFSKPLSAVRLIEIARKKPPTVRPTDSFGTVAKVLIRHPSQTIFITDENDACRGAIVSSDILQFAQTKELAEALIAIDVSRDNLPVLLPEMKLPDALKIFASRKHEDALALVENTETKKLLGVVNRSDLSLALGEIMRREKVR